MKNRIAVAFVLCAVLAASAALGFFVVGTAFAQSTVSQGQAGTTPWTVTSPCYTPVESVIVFDGGGATNCPIVTQRSPARRSVTLCNSKRNTGTPIWTIRADGVAPTTAAGSPGQQLSIGDCATYIVGPGYTDGGVSTKCISDTGSAVLTITECL